MSIKRSFNDYLLQHAQVDVQGQFGLQLVGQQAEGCVDVPAPLYPTSGPGVVVPAQDSALHTTRHLGGNIENLYLATKYKNLYLKKQILYIINRYAKNFDRY